MGQYTDDDHREDAPHFIKRFILTYVGSDTSGKGFVDFGTNSGDSGFSHFLKKQFKMETKCRYVGDRVGNRSVTNSSFCRLHRKWR